MKKNTTRKFDPAGPFTTGQIKTMLSVSDRTVQKWCDSGMLPCYRLPGYGKERPGDRRVTRAALREFIAKHGIPTPEQLETHATKRKDWCLRCGAQASPCTCQEKEPSL